MKYYEIGINARGLKQHQTLTYSSPDDLNPGDIIEISLRNKAKTGVVIHETKKPSYATKDVSRVIEKQAVPDYQVRFIEKLSEYYATDLGASVGLIVPQGVEKKRHNKVFDEFSSAESSQHKLSKEQKNIVDKLMNKDQTFLLHGVTGSGKTRVYIEVANELRKLKLGTIILVPEIGLTSQMINEIKSYLKTDVFVIHSNQTEAERHKQWNAIRSAESPVVVGPRSALFSPIKKLGLIVVDEEHETSYKQDVSPKYHAVRAASLLRSITGCKLVLGSATPSIEDYYLADKNPGSVLELSSTVNKIEKPDITIVDLKKRDEFAVNRWIGDTLIKQVEASLSANRQVLLFQNRRGTSTSIICQNCGWVDECPNCIIPLTHHSDWGVNVCHTCNYRHKVMTTCPDCKKPELVYRGAGTKEIYDTAKKLFPSASIARFDSDILDKKDKLEARHKEIVEGKIDIIVGTQMVAKGLDIPNLGLVGVINADTALHLPDFSSSERTFQLISQVMGRVGRHSKGRVIIQTYSPDSPSIKLASEGKWQSFYELELASRKATNYPPFKFMMKLTIELKNDADARLQANKLAGSITKNTNGVDVLGPSPAFHYKTRTGWRWQVVLKSGNRSKLTNIAKQLPQGWQFELDPINLL